MMETKFKVGDKVIYQGVLAKVLRVDEYPDGGHCYSLEAVNNSEMTCTANEKDCELSVDNDFDDSEALEAAQYHSDLVLGMVDSITDKYLGDGSYGY